MLFRKKILLAVVLALLMGFQLCYSACFASEHVGEGVTAEAETVKEDKAKAGDEDKSEKDEDKSEKEEDKSEKDEDKSGEDKDKSEKDEDKSEKDEDKSEKDQDKNTEETSALDEDQETGSSQKEAEESEAGSGASTQKEAEESEAGSGSSTQKEADSSEAGSGTSTQKEAGESEAGSGTSTQKEAGESEAGSTQDTVVAPGEAATEQAAAAATTGQPAAEVFTAGELVFHGSDYEVTMKYDETAEIPAGAILKVREISKGSSEYQSYLKGAQAVTDQGLAEARFFDITIWSDGKEIQPKTAVRVNISYKDAIDVAEGGEVKAVHFEDGSHKADVIDADTGGGSKVDEITFDADSFSVYGVLYSVDFTYEGYKYSMEGEDSILLSELADRLELYEKDYDKAFSVKNVSSVSFTDNDLLKVEKQADGDWLLTSLASFTSGEILTIEMNDGAKFLIEVTDPPANQTGSTTTDLSKVLSSVTITGNGETFDANGQVTLIRGVEYRIDLNFMETDDYQFVDDDTTMTYTLPADLNIVGSTGGTFDMKFGSLGTLKNNTYSAEGNQLKVNWNTSDPEMLKILRAADNAHFTISLHCLFDTDSTNIQWSDEISTILELEDHNDANIVKQGTYNKDTDCIDYVVTVTSEGTTTGIKITDTITGSALTSNVHSIGDLTILKNGTPITVDASSLTVNGNSFELRLPDMGDGDKYEVKYSANVNYGELGRNGRTTYSETNNTVLLDYEDNPGPPKESSSYEYNIQYSSLVKNFTEVSDIFEEGGKKYRRITWEVTANDERKTSVDHITDTIRNDSQTIMKMDGTGITVKVTKEDGTAQTRTLSWGEDGANGKLVKSSDYSWTYNPPASDGKASYKITYQTIAEVTALTEAVTVNNDVEDGHNSGGGGTIVDPDYEEPAIVKSVNSVSEEEVSWSIDLTIPPTGTTAARITDYIPQNTQGGFLDKYKSCSVTGLDSDESYKVTFGFGRMVNKQFVLSYEDTTAHSADDVIGEVYIDFYHMVDGSEVPGLKATGAERIIHAEIVTENQREWLEATLEHYWWYYQHINTAKFGDIRATADAEPALKRIRKTKKLDRTVVLNDGKTYPCYLYEIVMEGVSDDRLQIFDTFDTEVFEIMNLDELDQNTYRNYNPFLPENEGHGYIEDRRDATTKEKVDSHTVSFNPTGQGAVISTGGLDRQSSGILYPCYMIRYYLVMKHPEIAAEKAMKAGGKITFKNAVNWDGAQSEVEFDYGNPIVDKSLVLDQESKPAKAHYTIVINPDKLRLNNGNDMTLTDEFSRTLSIDYTSIRVTTDPSGKRVTYDYYGNKGVYKVPDETKVTITYDCNVIGDVGTVRIYNKATLNAKYSDDNEEFLIIDSQGEGGAGIVYLDLLKYASENMQDGSLAGAKFRLLDSEKNVVRYTSRAHDPAMVGKEVTFTTGSDGVLHIMLSRYEHGMTIKKNTTFYLEEIEPPEGYQLDPTLYSFMVSLDSADAEYSSEDGVWVYYVGDILKIRNMPETQSLKVTKHFAGNVSLTDEQKAKIRFIIQKVDEDGAPVTGENAYKKTLVYSDLENDEYTITEETAGDSGELTFTSGFYKVTEEYEGGLDSLGLADNVLVETSYSVNSDGSTVTGQTVIGADSVTVDKAPVPEKKTTNVIFTNKYSTAAYYFTKISGGTEEPLEGAVFSVYKAEDDSEAVTSYTTGPDGRFSISRTDGGQSILKEDTLYYVVETGAPEGHKVPDPAPRYYFYFGSEGGQAPAGAEENNAIDLNRGSASEEVVNISEGSVLVRKNWKKADGSDIPDSELMDKSITVTLKRKTGTGEAAVVDPDFEDQKTLTVRDGFYGIWEKLDRTDASGHKYYYFVEETDAPEGFITIYTNNSGVEADGSGEIIITNKEDKKAEGTATVRAAKEVSGSTWPEDGRVTFKIARQEGEENEQAPLPDPAETDALTEAGEKSFEKISFNQDHIGKTYYYEITETATGFESGWTADPEKILVKIEVGQPDQDHLLHPEVTYSTDGGENYGSEASFYTITNTYESPRAEGTATVRAAKEVSGSTWPEDGRVTFKIARQEGEDNEQAPLPDPAETDPLTEAGEKSFEKISFDQDHIGKTYYYEITETATGFESGWTADPEKILVKIEVGQPDQDHLLHPEVTYSADGGESYGSEASFYTITNTYEAEGEIVLGAQKTLIGEKTLEEGQFEFRLTYPDGSEEIAKNDAEGKVTFDTIRYTQDDIYEKDEKTGEYKIKDETGYTYTINEVIPEGAKDNGDGTFYYEGYTYDGTTYTVRVELTDNGDGTITARVTGAADAEKADAEDAAAGSKESSDADAENRESEQSGAAAYEFVNAYNAEGTLKLDAEKKFKNGTLKGGEFTFELRDAEGNVLQSRKNDAAGKVSFGIITYEYADIAKSPFTYTVQEVAGDMDDVTYDETVYTVTVSLKDNEDGTLEVTKEIDQGGELKFVNENHHKDVNPKTSITLGGVKEYEGQTLKKDQFEFELTDENGRQIDTARNDADGNFTFGKITYKRSDLGGKSKRVYTYKVKEVKGDEEDIDYDTKVYTVKVTVTDNGDGTITAKADQDRKNIKFVNKTDKKKKHDKKSKDKKSAGTGDNTPLGLLIGGVIAGAAGLAAVLWIRRRNRK